MKTVSTYFRITTAGIVAVMVLYGLSLFLGWGGLTWYQYTTNIFPVVLAFFTGWTFLQIANQFSQTTLGIAWRFLALGVFLWAVAESMWFYRDIVLQVEGPSSPVLDFFWLAGYPFLIFGVWLQARVYDAGLFSFKKKSGAQVLLVLFGVALFFVIAPIIQESADAIPLDYFISLAYPILDFVTIILMMSLFFSLQGGRLASAWRGILGGFMVITVADLLYAFLDWRGWYYPDRQITVATAVEDYVYMIGYVILLMGAVWYVLLNRQSVASAASPARLAHEKTMPLEVQNRAIVFTDANDRIILASAILAQILGVSEPADLEGRALPELLPEIAPLLKKVRTQRVLRNALLSVQQENASMIPLRVSGLARYQEQPEHYAGSDLLIETLVPLADDDGMTEEQMRMADFLAAQLGVLETERRQILERYLQQVYDAFLAEARRRLGDQVVQNIVTDLAGQVAGRYRVIIAADSLHWPEDETLNTLQEETASLVMLLAQTFGEHIGIDAATGVIYRVQDLLPARERQILESLGVLRQ